MFFLMNGLNGHNGSNEGRHGHCTAVSQSHQPQPITANLCVTRSNSSDTPTPTSTLTESLRRLTLPSGLILAGAQAAVNPDGPKATLCKIPIRRHTVWPKDPPRRGALRQRRRKRRRLQRWWLPPRQSQRFVQKWAVSCLTQARVCTYTLSLP